MSIAQIFDILRIGSMLVLKKKSKHKTNNVTCYAGIPQLIMYKWVKLLEGSCSYAICIHIMFH